MKIQSTLLVAFISLSIVSCGPVPFGRLGSIQAEFAWADSAEGIGRSLVDSNIKNRTVPSRSLSLPPPDVTLAPLSDFYQNIGDRIGGFTPSSFKLWIQEIVIYNDKLSIELDYPLNLSSENDTSKHYADFTSDYILIPVSTIPRGVFYSGLFFFFLTTDGLMSLDTGGVREIDSDIVVSLPEYENELNGRIGQHIEAIDGDVFTFNLDMLQPAGYPGIVHGYLPGQRISRIEQFIYRTGTEYRAILPGVAGHPEIWSTKDPDGANLPGNGSIGDASAIFIPFDGVYIPETAKRIRFHIVWELEDIIEIYDNKTPEIFTDDVIVLAENFWERLSIIPIIDY